MKPIILVILYDVICHTIMYQLWSQISGQKGETLTVL